MHILYFHQHFSTPDGSVGTRSYEMAKALIRSGHTVTIVCGSYDKGVTGLYDPFRNGKRRGYVDGIEVIEFNLNYENSFGTIKRIKVFLKFALASIILAIREPSDIVFCTTTPLTAGFPGIVARWLKKKRFVFEVRDLWPELPRAMGVIKNPVLLGFMSAIEFISYHSAERLVALSPGIVDGITARKINNNRIIMLPNGCDLQLFLHEKQTFRPSGISQDKLLAIFAGAHGPANGLGAVLDAALILKKLKRDDICIVLVGHGSEKSMLQKRAKMEELSNIIFLDPLPKTELAKLMSSADLGLQVLKNVPEFYDGTSPNKFFDYIACGLPVLTNYPGWLASMINDNDCGFSVQPDNPLDFAQALILAAENRNKLKQKGKNARQLAEDKFSRRKLSKEWVEWVTFLR